MYRYRLIHDAESFRCPECGQRCRVNDVAVQGLDGRPYCSEQCQDEAEGRRVDDAAVVYEMGGRP